MQNVHAHAHRVGMLLRLSEDAIEDIKDVINQASEVNQIEQVADGQA